MDLMEFALKIFLFFFFFNLEIAGQVPFGFSLKKEQNSFTKNVFTAVMDSIILVMSSTCILWVLS